MPILERLVVAMLSRTVTAGQTTTGEERILGLDSLYPGELFSINVIAHLAALSFLEATPKAHTLDQIKHTQEGTVE